ncbi:hypothetical protein CEP54_006480 [Fusarium duplospermum]|uniref:Uncharacterized protein n=1 Tax=Fusarium duplospermum TaxID=1325734 RepID=A0A428Q6W1_9HYPO|nr:hypothetical protein CEP54_006480 [Fusarium duplospermum]
MLSPVQITITAFGVSAFVSGVSTLVNPNYTLEFLNLPLAALPSVRGNALAAIGMGIYYSLAAFQNNTAFFAASVPMRLLSATIFWFQGWEAASIWEGTASIATGMALLWQLRLEKNKME